MSTSSETKDVKFPDGYELITEGTVSMIYPKSENSVFYNPVQVQNRDLSILMITLYAERRARRIFLKSKRRKDKMSPIEAEEAAAKIDWAEYVRENTRLNNSHDNTKTEPGDKNSNTTNLGGLRILDALAASGLRSIRYHKEIPGVKEVIINDMEQAAVDLARENLKFNNVPMADVNNNDEDTTRDCGPISIKLGDATTLMYNSRHPSNQFDVIDLDPYGSASPFIDAAMQAVKNGGMLCVTCTDMAALGGSHPDTCFGRYGSMPLQRSRYLQELALRILLQSLSRTANTYGKIIKPILSVGMAFYVRVFVEVYEDKAGVSQGSVNIGHVYQSTQCDSFYTVPQGFFNGRNYQPGRTATMNNQDGKKNKGKNKKKHRKGEELPPQATDPLPTKEESGSIKNILPSPFQCPETKGPFKIGGPIWLSRLHDYPTVEAAVALLETYERDTLTANSVSTDDSNKTPKPIFQTHKPLHGLLTSVSEELPDQPLYYTLPGLSHTMHCTAPPSAKFNAALQNAGYQVSAYHKEPNAIKTDAPPDVVWDIMRAWCKLNPVAKKWTQGLNENSAVARILQRGMVVLTGEEGDDSNSDNNDNKGAKAVDFTVRKKTVRKKACRFPMNPQKNWGPKPRAGPNNKKRISNNETGTGHDKKEDDGSGEPPLKKKIVEGGLIKEGKTLETE